MKYDIVTVVGNRPQFIKMAPISAELRKRGYREYIIHTGQHYDENMSDVFFRELDIAKPDVTLHISSRTHGAMTAEILAALEKIFLDIKPRRVLLYGDTNSTLAAALAAVKLQIPIAHVEAGPRIYDMTTPEEINRLTADRASSLLFCPDIISVQNLAKENITEGVYFTGDVMYDTYRIYSEKARKESSILSDFQIEGEFALMTAHRPNNTDRKEDLERLIEIGEKSPYKVVFCVHPRTKNAFQRFGLWEKLEIIDNFILTPALGYLDMMNLVNHSKYVLTDSGGLQKEAFYAGKPVIIILFTSPWPAILESDWQRICWKDGGIDVTEVLKLLSSYLPSQKRPACFGDGHAAEKIVNILEQRKWLGDENI